MATRKRYLKPSSQLSILLTALRTEPRGWHTLATLAMACDSGEATVSANLRHLRKREFGSHVILKRYSRAMRLYEYKLSGGAI